MQCRAVARAVFGVLRGWHLVALAGALALAGCGGGGGDATNGSSASAYTLTVAVTGSGSVISNPAGVNCGSDCNESYPTGTAVTLSAVPASGYKFSGWNGPGVSCPGTGSCTVSMTAARSVTAIFSADNASSYTLTVRVIGNGAVTSSPAGIDCGSDCNETYPTNTDVVLTATPAGSASFAGWSINGASCPGTGSCTVTLSADRNVLATFETSDLCNGLVTDRDPHPMTALAKPAKGQTVTDPQFGTTIRRISDVATDWGAADGQIKPAYSTIPAWNADESYLILYHRGTNDDGHHLYNGKTYQHLRRLHINPPDLEQFYWHPTDPDLLYYVNRSTNALMRYSIKNSTSEVVRSFNDICPSATDRLDGGTDPMYTSWGDPGAHVIGLSCTSGEVFAYNISTNTVGRRLTTSSSRAPVASASGTSMFFAASSSSAQVLDFDMNFLRNLDIDNPLDHASLGRLADGTDTHNAVSFDGNYVGSLVTTDMTNGSARVIVGPATGFPYPPSGTHVSAVALKSPGWVALSIMGFAADGQAVLDNELVLANTNPGGRVCRTAHHRSSDSSYWTEPHVVISPSGTRLLFGSDWGGDAVDSYVVELPSYQP